jgi:CheY-like chemotaxis protein
MRDENRAQNIKLEKDKLIIQKALDMATSANEEKNRFMAAASHDLRQPLHALTLFLGSLRHLVNDEKVLNVVDRIDETTTLLHEQFNSLLDLSKFDAGVVTADVTEFRLDHMLKNIADAAQQEAQQKGISLHLYTTPIVIRSDMLLMERMIRNLVTNAVRYTDSGAVSLHTRRVQHGLNIAVIDTGVGISPEEQQRIFQDYYQVSNKARKTGKGTGLGLAIVKRIANLLDIKITLKSSLGAGSTFNMLLPNRVVVDQVPDQEPPAGENQHANEGALAGMKVLIVDDDLSTLEAMTALLDTWGCEVDAVGDVEGFRLYLPQADQYDLVMLDDMLDDELSGLDLARQLQPTLPKSSILLVTGNANSARLNTLKDAGFKVLVKPVEHALLHETLTHMANFS